MIDEHQTFTLTANKDWDRPVKKVYIGLDTYNLVAFKKIAKIILASKHSKNHLCIVHNEDNRQAAQDVELTFSPPIYYTGVIVHIG